MGTRPRFTPRYDLDPLFQEVARRGITRIDLARLSGLSRPTVSHAEQGRRVSDLTVSRLAQVIGARREDFIIAIDDKDDEVSANTDQLPQVVTNV